MIRIFSNPNMYDVVRQVRQYYQYYVYLRSAYVFEEKYKMKRFQDQNNYFFPLFMDSYK